jgi:hypothetical protein
MAATYHRVLCVCALQHPELSLSPSSAYRRCNALCVCALHTTCGVRVDPLYDCPVLPRIHVIF